MKHKMVSLETKEIVETHNEQSIDFIEIIVSKQKTLKLTMRRVHRPCHDVVSCLIDELINVLLNYGIK